MRLSYFACDHEHVDAYTGNLFYSILLRYCPRRNASFACDQVNLCRPCAPFWATYMTKSQLQLHRSVSFPHGAVPFSYFIYLTSSALGTDYEAARRGEVSDCIKGPAGDGGGGIV